MSYERYRGYRLSPDDNGCWGVLNNNYDRYYGTYPSKAAAKRFIDDAVDELTTPSPDNDPSNPWGLEYCDKCMQMTNHDDEGCLKCRATPSLDNELRDKLINTVDNRRWDSDYKGGMFNGIQYTVDILLPVIEEYGYQRAQKAREEAEIDAYDKLEAKFDEHAKNIGLWGFKGMALDTLARSGDLSPEQKIEREAMVTERRALAVLHGSIAELKKAKGEKR